ncbi:amino acid ABC transporter substrate-binding protein, PAAT family [Salinihabitans flavidus]|uniref:Amino acid ABC transporter substrate-binding protein, PAAT family n=1 Tax=Salinihabitans flavidus TaxID=569882 RepID=A0A1H8N680_9RHOB|nr:transporter substrate-binding domain-containing protein [Salinihabitans flavidus]SEO25080.1 amino acid ABC transporter substrate-binding protein, PAAT family [Salinihabitans flavidus]
MTFKKTFAAGIATALLSAGIASAQEVKIGIAAEPYPPFASLNSSGEWEGWEIEVIDAVCTAAKLECVLTPVAWDGIIPSLTGGQIDAIMASMSITEERQKTIDFSDPYYNTPAVIVADKSLEIEPTPESLAGKIIGVQASTIHQAYAQEYFDENSELRVYQTQDEANQDLFAGRVDAIQADSIAMADFVNSDAGACCEIKGAVASDPAILGRGVGAGLRKGDDDLREALNEGIATILADGTHEEITSRYFDASIYSE